MEIGIAGPALAGKGRRGVGPLVDVVLPEGCTFSAAGAGSAPPVGELTGATGSIAVDGTEVEIEVLVCGSQVVVFLGPADPA